jgi:hypothetical protein
MNTVDVIEVSPSIDKHIAEFIDEQTVATVAVIDAKNKPYCFSCFYAFDIANQLLIFKSDVESHHIQLALVNPIVAGSILPDTLNKTKIKGIQFKGIFLNEEDPLIELARKRYYKKYPFAAVMKGNIWVISFNTIKYTDNTLIFGKKMNWQRPIPNEIPLT